MIRSVKLLHQYIGHQNVHVARNCGKMKVQLHAFHKPNLDIVIFNTTYQKAKGLFYSWEMTLN